jgi:hypothetical protein
MLHRRIRFLIVLIAGLHCVAAATTIQADKIVIIKSARTMTLLSGATTLKTYKVALGSVPVGPKQLKATTKRLRATTESTKRIRIASSTCRCTFHIPARPISNERAAWDQDPAAQL